MTEMSPAVAVERKNADERKQMLARTTANEVRQGWRVESQSDYQVVMVKGSRPNHLLHLFITIFTLGIWGLVWLGIVLAGGEKRQVVEIDEFGNTNIQR